MVYHVTDCARWPVHAYRWSRGRWVFVGAAASIDVARRRWGPK